MEIDPYTQEVLKEFTGRTFGPLADYLGLQIKDFVEKKAENLNEILKAAKRKQRRRLNPSEGVHPRVIREVLNTGTLSDDTVWAEYFGGVLASSTSENSQDDRGIIYTALIGRLSRYDLRFHCVLYLAVQQLTLRLMERSAIHIQLDQDRQIRNSWTTLQKRLFIPESDLISAMGFSDYEEGRESEILREAISSLAREALIDAEYYIVPKSGYKSSEDDPVDWSVHQAGYVFRVSDQSISLFMWALGLGRLTRNDFLGIELGQAIPEGVTVLDSVSTISERSRRGDLRNALRYSS
jgi:hypothetical protein